MAESLTTMQGAFALGKTLQERQRDHRQLRIFSYCIFFIVLPLTSLIALLINRRSWRPRQKLIATLAMCAYLLTLTYTLQQQQVELDPPALVALWLVGSIPLAPALAKFYSGLGKLLDLFKPITLEEQALQMQKQVDSENRRRSEGATRIATAGDQPVRGYIQLGAFIKGDDFPARMGVFNKGNRIYIEDRLIREHMIIIGTTGGGKSEAIKNLVYELLHTTDRDIFIVDGKGDEAFAKDIANLMFSAGRGAIPIFKMGQTTKGATYNAFNGNKEDIYNRLCALMEIEDSTGDSKFYADINRNFLQLVCGSGYDPVNAPTSFEEVEQRLNINWMQEAYRGNPQRLANIRSITAEPKLLNGLIAEITPTIIDLAPLVDPAGFSLEDSRGAVFCLRTQSVGDSSRRFLKFLVEDFKDFIGKRQKRPAVFIIDEFGAFGNNNITALLSLARGANLGVILATQDTITLGDDDLQRRILANTRTKILMVTDYPQELAELAGTKYAIEASAQIADGDATGTGSARLQHQFKIDMNEVAKLETGEAFLIRQRTALKFKGKKIDNIPHTDRAIATFNKPTNTPTPTRKPTPTDDPRHELPKVNV